MMCTSPFVKGEGAYPCGQCLPCRFNRRRMWTHRIMLEAMQHSDNSFWTLTYRPENLPLSMNGTPELRPSDTQLWLKRFRKAIAPLRVRFYLVGEYGDETWRPHYHVGLFGFPPCRDQWTAKQCRCLSCKLVRESWRHGHVHGGALVTDSAQYLAQYVTKKMTARDDERLRTRCPTCELPALRHPEFSRMSRQPGLGVSAMHEVASVMMTLGLDTSEADVPSALRHGSRTLPLGRHLRRTLRRLIGKEANAPLETVQAAFDEVRPLFEAAQAAPTAELRTLAFKNALIDSGMQARTNMFTRAEIFKRKRRL